MLKRLDIEGMSRKVMTCGAVTLLCSGLGDMKSLGLYPAEWDREELVLGRKDLNQTELMNLLAEGLA
jgi:hypothetical protein